jgi:hypothetical protein
MVLLLFVWLEMVCKENDGLEVSMIMEGFLDVLALLDQSLRVQGLALTLLISIIINVFKIDFYIIIIIIIIINVQMKTRKVSLSSIKTKQ